MGFSLSVLVARGFRTVFGSRVLSSAMLAKIDGKAIGELWREYCRLAVTGYTDTEKVLVVRTLHNGGNHFTV
jgi:hypothetical protein